MELYKALHERRSVRKYTDDPVPEEKLSKILEAARIAPSWANKQCWRYIVIKDEGKKEELYSALSEKNPGAKALTQAPVAVILCADPEASGKLNDKEYYMLDAGISMQQMMLAAHAEGLGTCWIGWIDDEKRIRDTFKIPENIEVVGITPLGYPAKESKPTPRKDMSEIVFYEEWGQ
ncbi:nitroreductase family protein [Natranaerobius thermophilus]|uniref:Nitroreductase n=1 Tax=Natranaerobius thermophilus (strain ATCC BAA-1301 / DSM 18059 / JW/NM-WN-LF) TaxID=457570 RepID=B2A7I4_NATTJ|nr:nitroreductase family protein [Natranaerobius thermophilus]ACB85693.1 nitroreductase [Natranaerobius thermophilus JW/NM-WN-LF]